MKRRQSQRHPSSVSPDVEEHPDAASELPDGEADPVRALFATGEVIGASDVAATMHAVERDVAQRDLLTVVRSFWDAIVHFLQPATTTDDDPARP